MTTSAAPDNCYPSDKGYRVWADTLLPELK